MERTEKAIRMSLDLWEVLEKTNWIAYDGTDWSEWGPGIVKELRAKLKEIQLEREMFLGTDKV